MKDLKEFRKFENEKKKSKWAEVRHHSELFVQTEIAVTHFRLVSLDNDCVGFMLI